MHNWFVIICCSQWLFIVWSSTHFNPKKDRNYDHNMLYSDCVSSIFNVYFLTILPCSTFEWQIKPARITLSSKNKIMIVIIPSQSMESKYVDLKTFFQHCKLTTFLHDYFDRKTYEQCKSSKSWHQTEQTTEENVETDWLFQRRRTSCFLSY